MFQPKIMDPVRLSSCDSVYVDKFLPSKQRNSQIGAAWIGIRKERNSDHSLTSRQNHYNSTTRAAGNSPREQNGEMS